MNLSINEQLMHDIKDANMCLFLGNLSSWVKKNATKLHLPLNQRNYHEGRYWSYNSIEGMVKFFGFWSTKNIRTIIKNCIEAGLIMTSSFNKKKYDNTLWYTLTDKGLEYFPHLRDIFLNTLADSGKQLADSGKPIPIPPTTNSNINITAISEFDNSPATALIQKPEKPKTKKQSPVELRELIEVYRTTFPDNPQPHDRVISTSLKQTLLGLIKHWPELDPEGKPLTVSSFERYLSMLKTNAPKFSLGQYTTANGNIKKNGLETFARWNTVVKFLENAYS